MTNNLISIVAQGWYGNRTGTEIRKEDVDSFICDKKVDRTFIPIPNTENIVILYNKYNEEEWLKKKKDFLENKNYVAKPLAFIPEKNLEIYSRCIVCRINDEGGVESLEEGDYEKFVKYLAE